MLVTERENWQKQRESEYFQINVTSFGWERSFKNYLYHIQITTKKYIDHVNKITKH